MTVVQLYSLCGVGLFALGFWGMLVRRHLLHRIIALNVMGVGVFMVLVAMAHRVPGERPDPVPHAMVLTGIVVAVSATALALALLRTLHRETGSSVLPPQSPEGGSPEGAHD